MIGHPSRVSILESNVYELLHIADAMRDMGPGWVTCIAAYILSPLLSYYYCSHIVNLIVNSIYYDPISFYMSSSFYRILSVSSVVVRFIALHHTYAHKPVLILVVCFTYLVSISHTVLFHITCVYSLPE